MNIFSLSSIYLSVIYLSTYHLFIYLCLVHHLADSRSHVNCVISLLFIVGSMQMLEFRYCINSGTHTNTHSHWHMHT